MPAEGNENVGVYELITELCNKTASKCSQSKVSQKALSAKMRSHAYEIILRKSKTEIPCCSGDPIKDLLSYHFILQKNVKNVAEYKRAIDLRNAIIEIRRTEFGEYKDCVHNTLRLLIALRNSVKDDFSEQMFQNPFSFGLLDEMLPKPSREPFGSSQPYPYFPSYVFELPYSLKTQGSKLDDQRSQSHTEYTVETFDSRSFLPDKYSQHGSLETKTFLSPMSLASMTSTCLSPYSETTILNYPRLTAPRDLQIPSSHSGEPNVKVSLASASVKPAIKEVYPAKCEDTVDIWELAAQVDKDVSLDIWEEVSKLPPITERPLIASSTREVALWRRLYGGQTDLHVVSEQQFIRHTSYLIIGVETSSFPFSEQSNSFYLKPGLSLPSVGRLAGYTRPLIAAGTYYRRLYRFAFNHGLDDHAKGLVYEAAREEVRKYLLKYRLEATAIFETQPTPTLLTILKHVEPLREEIETVAAVYKLDDTERGELGAGAELMSYLFREVALVTAPRAARVLASTLVALCTVYFKFIERFIFEGELDDQFGEFFVYHDATVAARSRRWWERGYRARPAAVPRPLRAAAAPLLLAGKSLRLLRLCNPNDPVVGWITAAHPAVRVCTSFGALTAQRAALLLYRTRARFVRGHRAATAADILAERRRLAQLLVAERRHLQRLARRAPGDRVDARLREEERNKMMEYYSKLNMEVEKSKIHTEWKMKRLQLDQSRIQLLSTEERNLKREKLELEHQRNEAVMQMSIQSTDTKSEDDNNDANDNDNRNNDNNNGNTDNNNGNNDNNNGNNNNNDPITETNMNDSTPSVEVRESPQESAVVANKAKAESSSDVFSAICNVAKSIFGVAKAKEETVCDNEVVIDSQGNVVKTQPTDKTSSTNFSTSNEVIGAKLNDAIDNQRYLEMRREALKNKDKVMAHEFGDKDNENNEIGDGRLIKLASVDEENNEEDWTPYAEARRNKRKVLGAEFGLVKEEARVITAEPRTEAQREALLNKQKVMGVEYNLPVEVATKKEALNEAQEEAVRNKTKILGSEYEMGTKAAAKSARKSSLTLNLKPFGESNTSPFDVASAGALTPGDLFTGLDLETPTTADIPGAITGEAITPRSEAGKDLETKDKPAKGFLTSEGFNFSLIVDEEEGLDMSPEKSPSNIDTGDGGGDVDVRTSVFNILDGSYSLEGFDPFGVRDLQKFSRDYFTNKLNQCSPVYTHPAKIMEEVKKPPYNNIFSHYDVEKDEPPSDNIATLTACLQRSVMLPLTYQLEVVNNSILTYFLVNLDLMEHLRCLKNCFFLLDGEFSRTLCHNLCTKLNQSVNPQELFNFATLHNILDKALASSITQNSSVTCNLSLTVSEDDTVTSLSHSSPDALRALSLCYAVRWPLDTVVTRDALRRYIAVFRLLVKVNRIEWTLADDFQWLRLAITRTHRGLSRTYQYSAVQRARHAMGSVARALAAYLAAGARPAWRRLTAAIDHAETLDQLYQCHAAYVKEVVFRCLLNNRSTPVMKLLNDIFTVILKFSRVLKSSDFQLTEDGTYIHPSFAQLEELSHVFTKLARYLVKVVTRLTEVGYQRHLAELLAMINLNGFYDSPPKEDANVSAQNATKEEANISVQSVQST